MRARSLTLLALTVSGAFATGWLLARLNRHEPGAADPAAEAPITAFRAPAGSPARDNAKASVAGISDPVV